MYIHIFIHIDIFISIYYYILVPVKAKVQTKKEKRAAADLLAVKIPCPIPDCMKELRDERGIYTYRYIQICICTYLYN
jgi:surface polysaccharide O-acyltransferase-like enzyme